MAQTKTKGQRKAAKMDGKRLRSFFEAEERTGVSYWTLWRGAEAGFFKTVYLGGRRMIPESELARIEEYGFGSPRKRKSKAEGSVGSEANPLEPAEAR
jgi:hypothetical protein